MCNCACFQEKYCKVYITRGAVSELLNTQLALASNDLRSKVLTICKNTSLYYISVECSSIGTIAAVAALTAILIIN